MNQPPVDAEEIICGRDAPLRRNDDDATAFTRHRSSNQGELACLRKLIPRRRNITKTPRRAIGPLPSITAKANTRRATKNRRKRRPTRRMRANTPIWRTARANRRNKVLPGETRRGLAGLSIISERYMTDDSPETNFPDHVDKAVRSVAQSAFRSSWQDHQSTTRREPRCCPYGPALVHRLRRLHRCGLGCRKF